LFGVPVGNAVVLIASGVPAATTERAMVAVAVCAGEPVSVTVTLKEELPLDVGVPVTMPAGVKLSPAGRLPEKIDQL
jgi:hypothetical protein